MKRTNIYVLIVAMLLLCVALGMGALEEKDETYIQESIEEPTKAPTSAELVIKSIKSEDEGVVFKIKNEGGSPAEDIYFAIIGIDYHPVFDENLRWNHSISDKECKEVINGVIRNSSFKLNTYDCGRSVKVRVEDPNNHNSHSWVNTSGEPLHLIPLLYKDYIDVIEPRETVESNMYVYWSHDRYIKVLYDGDYNVLEYKLYDISGYDNKGTFRGITG